MQASATRSDRNRNPRSNRNRQETRVMKTTPFLSSPLSSAVSVIAAFALLASFGVSAQTWVGGTGTWDNTTTTNWNPATVPANGGTVNLTQSSATPIAIDYAATNLTDPPGLYQLTIGNTGGGITTLTLDGTDSLPTERFILNPGGAVNMTGGTLGVATPTANSYSYLNAGVFTLAGGLWTAGTPNNQPLWVGHAGATGPVSLRIEGTGELLVRSADQTQRHVNVGGHATYAATIEQSGGSLGGGATSSYIFGMQINNNGVVNLSGTGTINSIRQLSVNSGGTLSQSGGTSTWHFGIGISGAGATLSLSGGTLYTNGDITVGAGGTVNYTGGQFRMSTGEVPINKLLLNGAGATWNMQGTTLSVNRGSHGGVQSVVTAVGSTVQGYGTIQDHFWPARPDFNGTFDNSGRVIANGYGTDRTLDLSRIFYVANTTDNTTDNGWFAVNQGKLLLPNVTVAAGDSTVNWGEAAGDETIDLVNSARIAFTGATAGSLSGSLLAVDRTDVPAFDTGMRHQGLISIHDFNLDGTSFDSFDLTIRYDDALAAASEFEDVLQIFHYTGGAWVPLDSTVDTLNKWVTASGIPSMSLFGVGYAIPEPTSALLLGLAGLLALRRRRRRG